ncbi:hypothetical protein, partial [Acinetobacter baumannii]|uniref:hypothetical protein n=1 Tax=Acinetobacter baumannii TaxID=470 RepID=UPI000A4751C5
FLDSSGRLYEQQYNTSGTARETDMDEEQKIYLETLKELNTRSISTRRITITFIYILLLATALVLTGIFAIKSKNNNPITNFISSMIDGNNELYQATTILN